MKDLTIRVRYEVYQRPNRTHSWRDRRLVGRYNCRCVAEDVKEYIEFTYGTYVTIDKELEEI